MPFNSSQIRAIAHRTGPAMILAGPGSGKTTVITYRTKNLIQSCGVKPEEVLVVTFTNAAAKEMKERYLGLSHETRTGVTFGTFHAVFYQMLRRTFGDGKYTLIKESEKLKLMTEVFREHYQDVQTDNDLFQTLLSKISAAKNSGNGLQSAVLKEGKNDLTGAAEYYEKKKQALGRIDFDDMLLLTLDMLKSSPEVLAFWQKKFKYIMVDEFQDINPVQYEIVKLLALPENNLFIVGDDDQSIYRFRGAEPSIMLGFPKDFPGCETIVLDVNYRSSEEIVRASLKLIGNNEKRYKKKLVSEKGRQEKPVIRSFKEETEACSWVAESIEKEAKEGRMLHEIAVLSRTNSGLTPVISALTRAGLPFWSRDQVQNLYRHFILKPVYGILNWGNGDHSRNNFLKFMNCPNRYIRRDDLLSETVDLESLKRSYEASPSRGYMAEKAEFLSFQLSMLEKIPAPYAKINYIRKYMELDRFAEDYASDHHMEPESLLAVLDEAQESARSCMSVAEWYTNIARFTKKVDELKDSGKEERRDHVMVSTFHASKGLEFETVYITGANERITPHEKAVTPEEMEEERRMFYVAMTRAKRNLYLLSVKERFGKKTEESRFVKEIR